LVVPRERRPLPAAGAALIVTPLVADAAYDTDRIVYRLSPYRLDYYEYHRWAASPGLLLANYLRAAYARAGLFRVVTAERQSESHALLTGRVTALEEVDDSPERGHAHVALELSLRDAESGAHLWSATYERRDPMPERSPEGLARALSGAIARIVADSAPAARRARRARPGAARAALARAKVRRDAARLREAAGAARRTRAAPLARPSRASAHRGARGRDGRSPACRGALARGTDWHSGGSVSDGFCWSPRGTEFAVGRSALSHSRRGEPDHA